MAAPSSTVVDHVQQFKDNNIAMALNMTRQLMVHCVMFVNAKDMPEAARAYLYTELIRIADLYRPEKAGI